jgi:hypothetical protein
MYQCKIDVVGKKAYSRRLDMAQELTNAMRREEWAVRLGPIVKSDTKDK